MTKLGVVTCQVLELEFAHILSNDSTISEILVVDDQFSQQLIEILEYDNTQHVSRVAHFEKVESDGLAVLIRVMEVGLHSSIQILTRRIKTAVQEIAPFVDGILLGYGLCGNALKNADDLFKDIRVPVMLPMENEEPVDDCVGLIIGGREKYYEEQCLCAGTMFMNAGFSRHWKKILSSEVPQKLIRKKDEILQRLMENYERSLLLPTTVLNEDELEKNTKEFNEKYGLKIESRPGTLTLLENAWQTVKREAGS